MNGLISNEKKVKPYCQLINVTNKTFVRLVNRKTREWNQCVCPFWISFTKQLKPEFFQFRVFAHARPDGFCGQMWALWFAACCTSTAQRWHLQHKVSAQAPNTHTGLVEYELVCIVIIGPAHLPFAAAASTQEALEPPKIMRRPW